MSTKRKIKMYNFLLMYRNFLQMNRFDNFVDNRQFQCLGCRKSFELNLESSIFHFSNSISVRIWFIWHRKICDVALNVDIASQSGLWFKEIQINTELELHRAKNCPEVTRCFWDVMFCKFLHFVFARIIFWKHSSLQI